MLKFALSWIVHSDICFSRLSLQIRRNCSQNRQHFHPWRDHAEVIWLHITTSLWNIIIHDPHLSWLDCGTRETDNNSWSFYKNQYGINLFEINRISVFFPAVRVTITLQTSSWPLDDHGHGLSALFLMPHEIHGYSLYLRIISWWRPNRADSSAPAPMVCGEAICQGHAQRALCFRVRLVGVQAACWGRKNETRPRSTLNGALWCSTKWKTVHFTSVWF